MPRIPSPIFLGAGVLIGIVITGVGYPLVTVRLGPPDGDYGDAPDEFPAGYAPPFHAVVGRFPTRHNTGNSRVGNPGAYVVNPGVGMLGVQVSSERGALDSGDPDGRHNVVNDDLHDDGLSVNQFPPLSLNVTLAPGAPSGTWYMNALVDADHNGKWMNEWYVKNREVNLNSDPNRRVTTTVPLTVPVPYPSAWMRLTLTREPIDESSFVSVGDWDGSGRFEYGEIEDYLYGFYVQRQESFDFQIDVDFAPLVIATDADSEVDSAGEIMISSSQEISLAYSGAQAYMASITVAYNEVMAKVQSLSASIDAIGVSVRSAAEATVSIPCATISAYVEAQAQAILAMLALAKANAESAAAAISVALSQAQAAADALAIALADAQALAVAFAEAEASARAKAQAAAEAWAVATANALAYSKTAGRHFFTVAYTNAEAFSLAFADAWAKASAAANAAADAFALAITATDTLALALSNADAVAQAASIAGAAVQVLADVETMIASLSSAEGAATSMVQTAVTGKCCCAATTYGGTSTMGYDLETEANMKWISFTYGGVSVTAEQTALGLGLLYEEGALYFYSESYWIKYMGTSWEVPFETLEQAPTPGEGQTHEDVGYEHWAPVYKDGTYVVYNPSDDIYAKFATEPIYAPCGLYLIDMTYAYCPKISPAFGPTPG